MNRIDETRPFIPIRVAVLTVSDTRSEADDRSGNTLAELAETAGHRIAARQIGLRMNLDRPRVRRANRVAHHPRHHPDRVGSHGNRNRQFRGSVHRQ